MCSVIKYFLFLYISLQISGINAGPVVTIANGKIQGRSMSSLKNRSFFAFMGIPFAKPPINNLRFQAPVEPDNWTGILGDDNSNKICPQLSSNLLSNEMEDCLYLSIYTPELPTDSRNVALPVMVVIHGGGFLTDSGNIDQIGPQYLIDYDIVIVVIQYRLGLFGFLSTEDVHCPGNNGLKDQQLALRWVQNNVDKFGGDPRKVTIFGGSAGGASVGFHLLASKNENLFRGAIQHSGSPVCLWAFQRKARDMAYQLASFINAEIGHKNSTEELLNFLKTVSVEQLKKASVDLIGEEMPYNFYNLRVGITFSPVIEIQHENSFITQGSLDQFLSENYTKVPMLMGVNSEEAILFEKSADMQKESKDFDMHPERLVSPGMNIVDGTIEAKIAKRLQDIYTPTGSFENNLASFVKFFSDEFTVRGTMKQARLLSKHTEVFFYEFAYRRKSAPPFTPIPGTDTVNHGDELDFFFRKKGVPSASTYPEEDKKIMEAMLYMWTNFIKYENPTPEAVKRRNDVVWDRLNPDQFNYLLINETIEMKTHLKQNTFEPYDSLYRDYALPPHVTF